MTTFKADATAAVSGATYLGVTLAEANLAIQFVVGCLTVVSLVLLIAVHIKKLRDK